MIEPGSGCVTRFYKIWVRDNICQVDESRVYERRTRLRGDKVDKARQTKLARQVIKGYSIQRRCVLGGCYTMVSAVDTAISEDTPTSSPHIISPSLISPSSFRTL